MNENFEHIVVENQYPSIPINPIAVKKFATQITRALELPVATITIVFVDNRTLQELHLQYLNDDSPTDIMTFPLNEPGEPVEADMIISLEMAQENARYFGVTLEEEVKRLIVHGILHLSGLEDATPEQQQRMRQEEDRLLTRYGKQWQIIDEGSGK